MLKDGLLDNQDLKDDKFDIRKKYILTKFGQETYDFEEELEFLSFPDKMFYYDTNLSKLLNINHDYNKKSDDNTKKVIVDLNPKIEIEI